MRGPKLSRRGFFKAAATTAAAGAAVTILSGCTHGAEKGADTSSPVVVDEGSAPSVTDDYQYDGSVMAPAHEWSLPLGNVLHAAEGTWIPVATAGSSATPMVVASALSLESGKLLEVVSAPKGQATTTVIYDVACSDSVYAWV